MIIILEMIGSIVTTVTFVSHNKIKAFQETITALVAIIIVYKWKLKVNNYWQIIKWVSNNDDERVSKCPQSVSKPHWTMGACNLDLWVAQSKFQCFNVDYFSRVYVSV